MTTTRPPEPRGSAETDRIDLQRMNGGPALYWKEKVANAARIIDRVQTTGNLDHDDAEQLIESLQAVEADVRWWQHIRSRPASHTPKFETE